MVRTKTDLLVTEPDEAELEPAVPALLLDWAALEEDVTADMTRRGSVEHVEVVCWRWRAVKSEEGTKELLGQGGRTRRSTCSVK